ncbi:hypothetical protein CISG_00452 [Coccidioides immitis RMSCC 3703]|uniref:Uncharacterized protein n=1 Tax=Coccidioides immitis RMSCC 3703 TaxID=454286 RepID=A0A0J8QLU3_COCIT|nr:hypothetical protein CISG_00452 [Coccidioides immitis RMSCC 3703]
MKAPLELPIVSLLALFPVFPLAQLDCTKIVVDAKTWDVSKLGGPHSVYNVVDHPPSVINTTYTLDLCKPLPKNSQCPSGTYGRRLRSDDKGTLKNRKAFSSRAMEKLTRSMY